MLNQEDITSPEDSLARAGATAKAKGKKSKKKGDGFDGFGSPDPFNRNDDDEVDAGEPNAPDQENPNDDANMVSDDDSDDDSFLQIAAKKDDDDDDTGDDTDESNDANMVTDDDAEDDDDDDEDAVNFLQVKKGDGFDGFGTPDPFNQNEDDQVDAGEPNAPDQENPNDDANMVSDDDSDDDSFIQIAAKKIAKVFQDNGIKKFLA